MFALFPVDPTQVVRIPVDQIPVVLTQVSQIRAVQIQAVVQTLVKAETVQDPVRVPPDLSLVAGQVETHGQRHDRRPGRLPRPDRHLHPDLSSPQVQGQPAEEMLDQRLPEVPKGEGEDLSRFV